MISKIDDDSLQEIESFRAETFPDDMKYMYSSSPRNCRSPPVHVKKLKMFVEELQPPKKSCQKHKRPVPMSASASKKLCPSSDEQSNEDSSFPEEVVSCARRCVSKWHRSQRDVNIKKLKEHVDFEINSSSKECKWCGKSYTLAHKNGKSLVSNWSSTLHNVQNLSHITDSKFYVFLQGPVQNQLQLYPLIGFQSI